MQCRKQLFGLKSRQRFATLSIGITFLIGSSSHGIWSRRFARAGDTQKATTRDGYGGMASGIQEFPPGNGPTDMGHDFGLL
jgi:hypothetical protein